MKVVEGVLALESACSGHGENAPAKPQTPYNTLFFSGEASLIILGTEGRRPLLELTSAIPLHVAKFADHARDQVPRDRIEQVVSTLDFVLPGVASLLVR